MRILIVDHDTQFRQIISAALSSRGHTVVEAPCGRDGVDAMTQHQPDAVIIDGLLPDGDGLVWIPQLRQVSPGVPIVFVSSFYRDMGALRHVHDELRVAMIAHKPLEVAPFVAQIDALIDSKDTETKPASSPQSRTMPGDVVIVVGGSKDAARALVSEGRKHGYAVVHVAEPSELVERAKVRMPAAVLIDMTGRSPEMLTRIAGALRTVPGAEGVAIAVLESSSGPVPEAQAVHAGASLRLPAGTSPEAVAGALGRLLRERPQQTRVLVVDDDVDFGNLVIGVLGPRGIAAHHITDPVSLFDAIDERHPDLVLLDMSLPRANSLELCRQIRASPKWRHVSVLFLTEQSSVEQRIAAFRAGADDYLVKPVVNEELLARVEVRVERAKLMRDRADRDPLTGLTLRRGFLEQLEMRLSEARRYNRPLSLCLLDLDHFKKINDDYGHLVGDRVLAVTGQLLATRLRTEDMRGRWGGEEFIVALPNAPLAMARQVIVRLLEEQVATHFSTDDGRDFRVSFSAGVAAYPDDGETASTLVRIADERLYGAKKAGRSRAH